MKPAILFVSPSSFVLAYQLKGQIESLNDIGCEVHVACEIDDRARQAAREARFELHDIRISTTGMAPIRDWKAFFNIMRIVKNKRCGLVVASTKKAGLLCSFVGKVIGARSVYVVRGMTIQQRSSLHRLIFNRLESVISALSDKTLFYSQSNKEYFLKSRIIPSYKAIVVGKGSVEGVDTKRFKKSPELTEEAERLRQRKNLPAGAFVFGYVGRLAEEKGVRTLHSAWKLLRENHSDAFLLIVSPPEIEPSLSEIVSEMRKDERVRFSGYLTDPRPAYSLMHCLILPSYSEGFSSVVLEAAALGIPTIASNVLGNRDAVVEGQTGLLFELKNTAELSRAMEKMISDSPLRTRLGLQALKRCESEFSSEIVCKGYAQFFLSIYPKNEKKRFQRA